MDNFPPNSRKAEAEPERELKQVTSAETVRRKKGLGRKFKETFFGGSGRDALSHMGEEVVVPAIRDLIYDALHRGLDEIVYGGSRVGHRRNTAGTSSTGPRVDYSKISTSRSAPAHTISRRARARHDFDELIIPSRQDAEEVLDQMFEILSRDGEVTVADLYTLTGIRPDHTDVKWGWTNLRGAKALRLRQGGFLLDLPTPEELR